MSMVMANNYCSHCGAKIAKDAKFCHKCGRPFGENKRRIGRGLRFFAASILLSLVGGFLLQIIANPNDPTPVLFFIAAVFFYLLSLIEFFRWLFRKNKYVAIGILVALVIVMLSSSFLVVYFRNQQAYLSQIFEIQDIGGEVAYAKSIGDDLMAGRQISEAEFPYNKTKFSVSAKETITTMAHVHDQVNKESVKMSAKKVNPEIGEYKTSVETWIQEILTASSLKNPESPSKAEAKTWQNLPASPQVVAINLEDDKRVRTLETLVYQVNTLKDTGDSAIGNQDRSQMRHVFAKASIQSNFLQSLSKTADICSRRGCAPEVAIFISGVQQSAHNYVEGSRGAAQDWKNTWDGAPEIIKAGGTPLGGLGITQGSADPNPPPNPPTTIRSVSPFFRPWPQTPPWDGHYTSSVNANCDAESHGFVESLTEGVIGDFEVRGGKFLGGGAEVTIDDSGQATYSVDVAGISISVDYYFVPAADGGVSLSGSFSVSGGDEDATVSCTGDFSGSRISQ